MTVPPRRIPSARCQGYGRRPVRVVLHHVEERPAAAQPGAQYRGLGVRDGMGVARGGNGEHFDGVRLDVVFHPVAPAQILETVGTAERRHERRRVEAERTALHHEAVVSEQGGEARVLLIDAVAVVVACVEVDAGPAAGRPGRVGDVEGPGRLGGRGAGAQQQREHQPGGSVSREGTHPCNLPGPLGRVKRRPVAFAQLLGPTPRGADLFRALPFPVDLRQDMPPRTSLENGRDP